MSSWLDGPFLSLYVWKRNIVSVLPLILVWTLKDPHTLHFSGHFNPPFWSLKGWYWPTSTFLSPANGLSYPTYGAPLSDGPHSPLYSQMNSTYLKWNPVMFQMWLFEFIKKYKQYIVTIFFFILNCQCLGSLFIILPHFNHLSITSS